MTSHLCASCAREGAGMRYRLLRRVVWYHPMCWLKLREFRFVANTWPELLHRASESVIGCGADASGGCTPDAPISHEVVSSHD